MKLRKVKIKNFRCLVDVSVELDNVTILVGENNSGKTAFLEAIRLALRRRSSNRVSIFSEYDFHMKTIQDTPNSSEGILISLSFSEDNPDEWSQSQLTDLEDIIQIDPEEGTKSIHYQILSSFDDQSQVIQDSWRFLTNSGTPLPRTTNTWALLNKFLEYVQIFYLTALRDSKEEFSPRSQYWGKILKNLKINEEDKKRLNQELTRLNSELMSADPKLAEVAANLDKVQTIMGWFDKKTAISALPMKPWELLSRSEVVIQGVGNEIQLPLSLHGQGTKSLSVLFLFQTYITSLLNEIYHDETNAILALEEPEAHLHPQTIRSLANQISNQPYQMLISTHSPYFIQEIPLKKVRMFKRDGNETRILKVKTSESVFNSLHIHNTNGLIPFCNHSDGRIEYNENLDIIYIHQRLDPKTVKDFINLYRGHLDIQESIQKINTELCASLTNEEINAFSRYVKRIRGEILFSRAWLLVEGQSDHVILSYFAEVLGTPFDLHGVSIIDYKNNGSCCSFVNFALAFEIPILILCDSDGGLDEAKSSLISLGYSEDKINNCLKHYPVPGTDLEYFLANSGFLTEYAQILNDYGISIDSEPTHQDYSTKIIENVRKNKHEFSRSLVTLLQQNSMTSSRVPQLFKSIIDDIIQKGKR